jgi:hypothetical protein
MKPPPPIYVWREPIDDQTVAVLASCFFAKGRCLYGLSVFLLVGRENADDWRWWRDAGACRLTECLAKDHGGYFPYVGYVERGQS